MRRQPHCRSVGLLGCVALGLCFGDGVASAAVVAEDFAYTPDNATLLGQTGGSGAWGGAWGPSTGAGGNTSRIKVDVGTNLLYVTGGYAVTQSGTGRAYGDFNDFRGINREVGTDLAGTVWFSVLVRNTGSSDHAGVQLNAHADSPFTGSDYTQGGFNVEASGTNLVVRYNGVNNTIAGTTLLANANHLLLGRITFQDNAANDRLDVWASPADLSNLGAPLFTANDADMGPDLHLLGLFAYGASDAANTITGSADALRASDGGGSPSAAFADVTGVPEPGTAGALALATAAGLLARRRRRRT